MVVEKKKTSKAQVFLEKYSHIFFFSLHDAFYLKALTFPFSVNNFVFIKKSQLTAKIHCDNENSLKNRCAGMVVCLGTNNLYVFLSLYDYLLKIADHLILLGYLKEKRLITKDVWKKLCYLKKQKVSMYVIFFFSKFMRKQLFVIMCLLHYKKILMFLRKIFF